VRRLTACGFTIESVSVAMGIPQATLERHFDWELKNGKLLTDVKILGGIAAMAEENDKTMMIFWAKARAGWRDVKGGSEDATATTFAINISNASTSQPTGITISHVRSLPEPEEEP
jgi:hypothetical protein